MGVVDTSGITSITVRLEHIAEATPKLFSLKEAHCNPHYRGQSLTQIVGIVTYPCSFIA